jgi:hypothetical protein
MSVNTRRGAVRNASRIVTRFRTRVSTAVLRGQLGPSTESALEVAENSMWSRQRPL